MTSAPQVLDARAGDVYTGGDGGPSPGFEGSNHGNRNAQTERPRSSADGSAAPDVSAFHLDQTLGPSTPRPFSGLSPVMILCLSCPAV